MKKSKKLAFFAAAMMIISSLASCGTPNEPAASNTGSSGGNNAAEENITLRLAWSGDGQTKESLDNCLKEFTEKTNVGVESIYIPGSWAEYLTKIQTMQAGGDQLDNAWVAIEGMQNFVSLGLGVPLTDFANEHAEEYQAVTDDIDPVLLEPLTVDGEVYALPWDWNNVVIHMNTALLSEAGLSVPDETWGKEEFLSYCEKLTTEKDGVKQYAIMLPDGYFSIEAWLYNNGASIMNDEFTESRLNSPESVEIFQLFQDLVYKYGYAPVPEKNVKPEAQLMNGQVAMYSAGRWTTQSYADNDFKDVAVQFLPSFKTNQPIAGIGGIFVINGTQHYEEAAELSTYIASPTFIEKFLTQGSIPALKSVADKVITPDTIPINGDKVYYPSASIAKAVHAPEQYPQCEDIVMRAFSEITVNQADVQSTLDAAAEEMNSILAANK